MNNKKKKKFFLIIAIAGVVLIALVAVIISLSKSDAYRLITVDHFEGVVNLSREGDSMEVFQGINLQSEDKVSTEANSNVLLLADDDKYILAEENTGLAITAVGNEEKGNITIRLEYGSALINIENKLEEESTFEVHTSNAVLSVRGTEFFVTYDKDLMCTTVEILEGTVEIMSENQAVLGGVGETYSINEQGMIITGTPDPITEGATGVEEDQETAGMQEIGEDIADLPEEGLISPITITQAEFESQYMEERIELTAENSHEYFEVIQKDGTYYFVLKPGYTGYGNGYTVKLDNGDEATVSTGASRYLFYMEGTGSAETWINSWVANGTIAKYSIPDDMWCKAGDIYIILIKMDNGDVYSIQR